MGRYTLTRDIHAPAAAVFRAFTDPTLAADWLHAAGIRDVRGPLDREGSTYTLVIAGPHKFRSRVVRSEPPFLHETDHRGPLGSAHMVATLSEQDGSTHLELTTEYALPFGALGRWLDRRFIDREPRAQANREVDRLVQLVSPGI
jgi:uncharacterized protein YndB with AHSA1/START domain